MQSPLSLIDMNMLQNSWQTAQFALKLTFKLYFSPLSSDTLWEDGEVEGGGREGKVHAHTHNL